MPKSRKFSFKILYKDKHTKAKTGTIETRKGKIKTPAFVPVATLASIKSLTPSELEKTGLDIFFVNTYHMLFRPGVDTVAKMGGLANFMNWPGPVMTDSGGFQAFSLKNNNQKAESSEKLVKISQKGITFKSVWDGSEVFITPQKAIRAQQKLGSDIMMALDECTFYPISYERAAKALERTHNWAIECLKTKQKGDNSQALYGIVQGSVFKDLRKKSAEFISSLPFDGLAIGSVANSKEPREKVFAVLDWTMPVLLKKEKPIHFLGIGEVEDIFKSVEQGIDSFDCVIPTRLARMGWIFDKNQGRKKRFRYDITKKDYQLDKNPLERECRCLTCINFSRAYINHLFRSRELLAYRLATYHNLYFYGNLMEKIRRAIADKEFLKLKRLWLK